MYEDDLDPRLRSRIEKMRMRKAYRKGRPEEKGSPGFRSEPEPFEVLKKSASVKAPEPIFDLLEISIRSSGIVVDAKVKKQALSELLDVIDKYRSSSG